MRFTGIKSRFVVAAAGIILILMGVFPKVAGVVASIPLPVLGGAGLVLFGSVAAAGVQTLSRVDLTLNRNLIIVAVAVALGVIPSTVPEFYEAFPEAVRLVFDSGITAAAVAAILLNILFNVLGGEAEQDVGDYGENIGGVEDKLTVMDANRLGREAFAEKFAPLFQGAGWVPDQAYESEHPFSSIHDLRHAFQTVVYDAPDEHQVELLRSYTPWSKQATARESMSTLSVRERRSVGLTGLSEEEDEEFQQMNEAYREKFGFPLVTAIRDHTKETLLEDAESRLKHNREQETLISVVEVVKIANYRLQDMVEESLIGARS
ncbi:hypothetical protein BH24ACT22_BH24ACT22_22050 [soil metagenome]